MPFSGSACTNVYLSFLSSVTSASVATTKPT
jgi:hypothetical protein